MFPHRLAFRYPPGGSSVPSRLGVQMSTGHHLREQRWPLEFCDQGGQNETSTYLALIPGRQKLVSSVVALMKVL